MIKNDKKIIMELYFFFYSSKLDNINLEIKQNYLEHITLKSIVLLIKYFYFKNI